MPERSRQPIPPATVPEHMIDAQALKHKAVGGAVSYFLRTLALFGVSLFAQVLLTDKLQPEDFGIYGFVIQMIGLLTFFSDVGLAAKLVQQSDEPSEAEYATAFTIQHLLGWFIVCCVGAVVVSGWFASQLGSVGGWIALSLAFSFPLASLKTVPALKLERRLQFQTLIIPQIVEHMVFNIVLIAGVWTHYGLWAYVGAIVLRSIAGVLAMASIEWWVPRFLIAPHIVRPLLKRGLQFQANDLLARVKDQFYFLMLGVVLPLREFGYLNWAKNWSMYPYNLTVQNVMAITFPTFARLQHHPELLRKAIEKTLYWIALSVTPMIVAMCVFVPPLATPTPFKKPGWKQKIKKHGSPPSHF
jgi:O-antigen/teichoic acid export membrane protein